MSVDLQLSSTDRSLFIASQAITITGGLLNLMVLGAFLKRRNLLNTYNAFNLSIVLADLALCFVYTIFTFNEMGRSVTNLTGLNCQIQGYAIEALNSTSVVTLLFYGLYQYQVFVYRRSTYEMKTVLMLLVGVWVFSFGLSTVPWWVPNGSHYVLQPSKLWCGFDYPSREIFNIILTWYNASVLILTPVVLAFTYSSILRVLEKSAESIKNHSGVRENKFYIATSRRIVRRAIVVTATFVVIWVLMGFAFAYQGLTAQKIFVAADAGAVLLARTNTLANPLVLILVDNNIKAAVMELFGLSTENIKRDTSLGSLGSQSKSTHFTSSHVVDIFAGKPNA
ncbi:hypothetical protein EDD86DRAFT_278648 [Gorgonomyces haynaldii]|nr:hypothetical protein EDD86DRAFT_278648 [Gorgonomyces haynaldii]